MSKRHRGELTEDQLQLHQSGNSKSSRSSIPKGDSSAIIRQTKEWMRNYYTNHNLNQLELETQLSIVNYLDHFQANEYEFNIRYSNYSELNKEHEITVKDCTYHQQKNSTRSLGAPSQLCQDCIGLNKFQNQSINNLNDIVNKNWCHINISGIMEEYDEMGSNRFNGYSNDINFNRDCSYKITGPFLYTYNGSTICGCKYTIKSSIISNFKYLVDIALNKIELSISPNGEHLMLTSKNYYKEDVDNFYYDDFKVQWVQVRDGTDSYISTLDNTNGEEKSLVIEADGPEHLTSQKRISKDKAKNKYIINSTSTDHSLVRIYSKCMELIDKDKRVDFVKDLILIAISDMVKNGSEKQLYISDDSYEKPFQLGEEENVTILSDFIVWRGAQPYKDWSIIHNGIQVNRRNLNLNLINNQNNQVYSSALNLFNNNIDETVIEEPPKLISDFNFNNIINYQLFYVPFNNIKSLFTVLKYQDNIMYISAPNLHRY